MFTGIIETKGKVINKIANQSNLELYIRSSITQELKIDQSIAHNGVCLTVDQLGDDWHRCTLIQETLDKTNFKSIKIGDEINLERSLKTDSRIDGHFVQGHVDCTVYCDQVKDLQGSWTYSFSIPYEYQALIVHKGSICINGVSLTISGISKSNLNVSIIPYTYHHTNFDQIKIGSEVNIEFDILGKYIKRMLETRV